jgi:D-alanine-D-alanine ligase
MSRPAVCFGSPSPEHDISVLTGLQAAHALANAGNDVVALYWSKAGDWYEVPPSTEASEFADGLPRTAEPVMLLTGADGGFAKEGRRGKRTPLEISAVVNCCHGVPGEDGTLQAMFDLAGIRYTGPSQWGAAIGMDKLAFSGTMAAAGVPSLPLWLVTDNLQLDVPGPFIVKPRFGGSSIGIEVVDDLDTAKALSRTQPLLREGAVVQQFLTDATDLNISIRTWPELSLSSVEKPLRTADDGIYSYADKYLGGTEGMASAPREMPADIPTPVEAQLRSMAAQVAELAMVRSVARVDFLWSDGGLWVNEINTIPGSLSWYFWAHDGIPFGKLLSEMLQEALDGPTRRFRTEGADGTALRSVGAIASKLA